MVGRSDEHQPQPRALTRREGAQDEVGVVARVSGREVQDVRRLVRPSRLALPKAGSIPGRTTSASTPACTCSHSAVVCEPAVTVRARRSERRKARCSTTSLARRRASLRLGGPKAPSRYAGGSKTWTRTGGPPSGTSSRTVKKRSMPASDPHLPAPRSSQASPRWCSRRTPAPSGSAFAQRRFPGAVTKTIHRAVIPRGQMRQMFARGGVTGPPSAHGAQTAPRPGRPGSLRYAEGGGAGGWD